MFSGKFRVIYILIFFIPGIVYSVDRDYKTQAEKQLEIQNEVSRRQSLIHFRLAEEVESEGNLTRALEKYENFLLLYEDSELTFDASYKIATIYQKMNEMPDAIEAFKKAYRIAYNQEKGLQAYLNAGRLYREIGDYSTAKEIFAEISLKGAFTRISRLATIELASLAFLDERENGNVLTEIDDAENKNPDLQDTVKDQEEVLDMQKGSENDL